MKIAPIKKELDKNNCDYRIINIGQHYDKVMLEPEEINPMLAAFFPYLKLIINNDANNNRERWHFRGQKNFVENVITNTPVLFGK